MPNIPREVCFNPKEDTGNQVLCILRTGHKGECDFRPLRQVMERWGIIRLD
ncbi:hypothetical protein GIKK_42 [Gordonia phage GiKK]|nr:hypothetical protein GIKK_42 [Gordonia phage GiKK]UVK63934.1 hypothetical protein SEA_BUTTON_40 [Gordonia phage Button]WKW84833.1 hypothetical protein SEA_JAMZY_42 [Gordonia phage Jamzy]